MGGGVDARGHIATWAHGHMGTLKRPAAGRADGFGGRLHVVLHRRGAGRSTIWAGAWATASRGRTLPAMTGGFGSGERRERRRREPCGRTPRSLYRRRAGGGRAARFHLLSGCMSRRRACRRVDHRTTVESAGRARGRRRRSRDRSRRVVHLRAPHARDAGLTGQHRLSVYTGRGHGRAHNGGRCAAGSGPGAGGPRREVLDSQRATREKIKLHIDNRACTQASPHFVSASLLL